MAANQHNQHHGGHAIPLTLNPGFRHHTKRQMAKMNRRHPINILAAIGDVPLTDVDPDIEYYGTVSVGTPGQEFKLDFDTGSSDIWFPSNRLRTHGASNHNTFNQEASSSFQPDPNRRPFRVTYGDGSSAAGYLGSDLVNVGGISVRQTVGLTTRESAQFDAAPEDGLFGLAFDNIESVLRVQTFMDNAIAQGALSQNLFSVFLPSVNHNGGVGGEYLFGGIDDTRFTPPLTYVPVTQRGYWQIHIDDVSVDGVSLSESSEGIIDTGTTLIIVSDATAKEIHDRIPGATFDPNNNGWVVPSTLQKNPGSVGFKIGGKVFNVPFADLVREEVDNSGIYRYSGVQGGGNNLWILGDVFIKNNYCVFDQGNDQGPPRVGIAPLRD